MKILCIGNVSYDTTILMDSYPVENIKYRVKEEIKCGGGPASNAAYLLGKWGMETYFAGIVGKDTYGKNILDEFKSVNVNTKYVEIDPNDNTTSSFIIVNNKTGSRTTFAYRKEDMVLKKKIDMKPDIILVDGQEFEVSKEVIKANPNAISVIDAGRATDNVIALAKMVNYVVCSKNFAEDYTKVRINLSDPNSIKEVYEKLERDFKNVVITLEEKGCLYKKDNIVKLMPTLKVIPKDSTGAGDLFHGAFVYSLANNFDIEKTVKISNITGSLAVTKVGTRYKVPDLKEVLRIYNENV
jgi:sugar/nucleoside kinase (ribokinase family)